MTIKDHYYIPDYQAMGDCRVCGHEQKKPWHIGEMTMPRIPVKTAEYVAAKHDLKQVLLIGWDGEEVHIVTYGRTKEDCEQAAKAQDFWTGKIKEFSFKMGDI